jgi:ABC-type proline/glycine betaine transport system permease subunit
MSAILAGIAVTVVFTIPPLVREIRLARRFDRPQIFENTLKTGGADGRVSS